MRFQVKALSTKDGVVSLSFDAADRDAALRHAKSQGYAVLALRGGVSSRNILGAGRMRFPLILFSQELLALLDAGLALLEAVETLAEKETRNDVKALLQGIIAELYQGRPFSYALHQSPRAFPPLFVATVRASEKTGDINQALCRFVAYQTQLDVVRKKVVSALIYPALLLCVGALVTLFLLVYVVPKFSGIYESMGTALPLSSRLLAGWGSLLQSHGMATAAVLVALVTGIVLAVRRPGTRQAFAAILWRIPALGERMRIYQLARFYRTLGMLLNSGTPVVVALEMASGVLETNLKGRLSLVSASLKEGRSISHSMQAHGLSTPVALRMLRVGERTGKMGEMMERIAEFYDGEMARWVDWFTRLFEPLLMALIGLVIGLIVVSMYMPIFELAGSLK